MEYFCSLFSGSAGNSTYIGDENSGILIDAGKSCKYISAQMKELDFGNAKIEALFITHTHSDHIGAVEGFTKRFSGVPVVGSSQTAAYLREMLEKKGADFSCVREMEGLGFGAGRFWVSGFPTPHDCEGSRGFTVSLDGGYKMGVCTDLGEVTQEVEKALSGCSTLLIESNHDVNVLKAGSYPFKVKQRILSSMGHLSNSDCGRLVALLAASGTKNFVLGHLSGENNMPDIAFETVSCFLEYAGARENKDYFLRIASPSLADRHYRV